MQYNNNGCHGNFNISKDSVTVVAMVTSVSGTITMVVIFFKPALKHMYGFHMTQTWLLGSKPGHVSKDLGE
jgi:hypothetical protein